jgi:hypothetical protein
VIDAAYESNTHTIMLWHRRIGRTAVLLVAVMIVPNLVFAAAIPLPVRCTAFAIDKISGASAPFNVTVTRWSPRTEVEQLASAFNETGTDGWLRVLQRLPRAGTLRVGDSLGIDVRFAQLAVEPDGSQRLMLIADRRIGVNEAFSFAPSTAYPLTVIELRLDAQGKGTGTMWPVARIDYWDLETQTIVIDNYAREPVDLMAVRWQGGSTD